MGHNLTFGDVSIKDFDVCISGEGLFNAPKKDVESIDIPGRNGALLIDNDRFDNIEVTYPAAFYKEGLYNFIANLSALRAAFLSKKGYQRLEDSFHPDEYRMGAFIGGLEVDPVKFNTAATFDMIFNCKPQRFLKSGEVEHDLTGGGSILNPTNFTSKPLLKVEGRGEISVNGYHIEVNTDPLGKTPLFGDRERRSTTYQGITTDTEVALFQDVPYNPGDQIEVYQSVFAAQYVPPNGGRIVSAVLSSSTNTDVVYEPSIDSVGAYLSFSVAKQLFTEGTAKTVNASATFTIASKNSNNQDVFEQLTLNAKIEYDPVRGKYIDASLSAINGYVLLSALSPRLGWGYIYSTVSALNEELYIDCEIGEAYIGDQDYNNAVAFPNDLPVLSPGENIITAENTITSLKIVPRWWRI